MLTKADGQAAGVVVLRQDFARPRTTGDSGLRQGDRCCLRQFQCGRCQRNHTHNIAPYRLGHRHRGRSGQDGRCRRQCGRDLWRFGCVPRHGRGCGCGRRGHLHGHLCPAARCRRCRQWRTPHQRHHRQCRCNRGTCAPPQPARRALCAALRLRRQVYTVQGGCYPLRKIHRQVLRWRNAAHGIAGNTPALPVGGQLGVVLQAAQQEAGLVCRQGAIHQRRELLTAGQLGEVDAVAVGFGLHEAFERLGNSS